MAEALAKVKNPADEEPSFAKATEGKGRVALERSRIENLEENLLGFILKYPEHIDSLKNLETEYFVSPIAKKIFQELKKRKSGEVIDLKELQKKILPLNFYYLDHIMFQVEHYNLDKKEVIKEINFCIREIKSNHFKKKLSEISLAIKKSEREGDKKMVKKLTEEFNKLSKEMIK